MKHNGQISPYTDEGVQFAWDSTSMQWAMDCLWKYKTHMLDGYFPKYKSPHLLFGGCYASALERYHKLRFSDTNHEDALRAVVLQALKDTWFVGEDGIGRPWESTHNTKTRENLIRTIVWYLDQYENDNLKPVMLADGTPAVEYSFSLDIGDGLIWSGHIDRLVEFQGDVYVQDQKTTGGTVGPYYFDNFNPDVQMTGYSFAGRAIYKSPVKGVVIDAAQVAVGFSRFERGFTHRTDAQLDEWLDDTRYWIGVAQEATRTGRFPRNRTSCNKFGGCEFRTVCSRSPEVRENFLKGDYEQRPVDERWNPLVKR